MDNIKVAILIHLILGPIGMLIIAYDAYHPELWDTWYRNPANSIPYCILLDAFIWAMLLIDWWKERRQAKAVRLMAEANRLRAQGCYREAEILWQEALSLIGQQ